MKIGFFIDAYNLISLTGVDISVETFRKNLEKLNQEVFIFAPKISDYKDKNPKVFRFKSFRVFKKPEMYLAFPPFLKEFTKENIKIPKLDLVHVHSPFSMGLWGKYVAHSQKIPLIYTHHTHYPEYAKIYLKAKILFPEAARIWSKWFSNKSDIVIAPSKKIEKFLQGYGVKKPIFVLSTGIDLNRFKKSKKPKELRKNLNINPGAKILLFVGRIGKEKNIDFLLDVLKEILKQRKDVILLMVGDGSYLNKFKKLVERFKIEKFIKFTGRIPCQEIPIFYQASDIFVFSSLTETQGLVILEAMACGLPVVALKDDAFKGIVINNQNGFLVEDSSPTSFAQEVTKILDNPLIYKRFSANSQKFAKEFSEEKQAKKLLKIYRDLTKMNMIKNKR